MLTLIIGGARSGKSGLAQRLAEATGRDVLFLATMQPLDDELRARVEAHRADRPPHWRTVEEPRDVLRALRDHARPGHAVVVDCATLWISNLLIDALGDASAATATQLDAAVADAVATADALAVWAEGFDGRVFIVSNEVGAGVVPPYPLGRAFRDALGGANHALACRAAHVHAAVAGLVVDLRALGALPIEAFLEGPP